MNKADKKNILIIEWEDSYGATGGWQDIENYKPKLLICKSVGFKVYEDDYVIALAPNYAEATEYTHEQANGLMVIPQSSIRKINNRIFKK